MGKKTASWQDVNEAKRKATARIILQVVWALHNNTTLSNDDIYALLAYVSRQQDSFNKGYINYKDVVKSLLDERELDLREVLKLI